MRRALVGVGVIFSLALTGCSVQKAPVEDPNYTPAPAELEVQTVTLPDGSTAYCVIAPSGAIDCLEG